MKNFLLILSLLIASDLVTAQAIIKNNNATKERVFINDTLLKVGSFFLSDYELYRAPIFQIDISSDKLFAYDYSQKNLFRLDLVDYKINGYESIGNGLGSGPGEFRNPTDICVLSSTESNKVIIIDADLSRVSIWDVNSEEFTKSFKTKKIVPFRVACSDEKIIVYNSNGSKFGDYQIYDKEGNFLGGMNQGETPKDAFLDSGYIVSEKEKLYFTSEGRSEIKKYDLEKLNLIYEQSLVDAQEDPNTLSREKNEESISIKRSKSFKYNSRGIGIVDNFLVVLFSGRKDAHGKIVDFYDESNLNYMFSVLVDQFASGMSVRDGLIILDSYNFDKKERELILFKLKK
ncbi:MAG: hypothetical protein ABJR05_06350 [Balneola sp.]